MPARYVFLLLGLLCSISPSLQSPVPDIPTATQAILTTLTIPATTSYSIATLATVITSTVIKDETTTITTKISSTKTTITSDLGPTDKKTKTITSAFVTSYPYISSEIIVSIIGSTTLLGPNPLISETSSTTSPSTSSRNSSFSTTTQSSTSTPISAKSTSISTSTATLAAVTSHPPSLVPSSSSSTPGLSTTAKIGLGVAIPCTLIIVGGILAAFWMGQRRKGYRKRKEYTQMDWQMEKTLRHDESGPVPLAFTAAGMATATGYGYRGTVGGMREQEMQLHRTDTSFRLTMPAPTLPPPSESDYSRSDGAVDESGSGWRRSRSNTIRTRNSTIAEMPGDEPAVRYSWSPLPGNRRSVRETTGSMRVGRDGDALR